MDNVIQLQQIQTHGMALMLYFTGFSIDLCGLYLHMHLFSNWLQCKFNEAVMWKNM